jgi:hypothetical protein
LTRCGPTAALSFSILQVVVVTVTAGPGDQGAADAARGYLRASHADREHVLDVLKAAFVQGMLSKAELDARVARHSPRGPMETWPRSPPTFLPG